MSEKLVKFSKEEISEKTVKLENSGECKPYGVDSIYERSDNKEKFLKKDPPKDLEGESEEIN